MKTPIWNKMKIAYSAVCRAPWIDTPIYGKKSTHTHIHLEWPDRARVCASCSTSDLLHCSCSREKRPTETHIMCKKKATSKKPAK